MTLPPPGHGLVETEPVRYQLETVSLRGGKEHSRQVGRGRAGRGQGTGGKAAFVNGRFDSILAYCDCEM